MTIEKQIPNIFKPDVELLTQSGVYRSGFISGYEINKAFVQFVPNNGKQPAQNWSHEKPIAEFSIYRGKVYLLDIAGKLYVQQDKNWELVQGKSGYFATFVKLPNDLDLITCFPVPVTKQLPEGQDRIGGCRSMEKGWSVEVTWDQSAHPPVVCGNVMAITGFVITGKQDMQGWHHRQKILQRIRLSDGQISTVRRLPKDFVKHDLCAYLPH